MLLEGGSIKRLWMDQAGETHPLTNGKRLYRLS
jgi:hypothetical protein